MGSFSGFLRRLGADPRKLTGFHFHEIPGRGSVPCLQNGVVEPIGQAIIAGFYARPDEMTSMAKFAVEDDRFHLVWRLNGGAREMTSATDPAVASAAAEVVSITEEYIRHGFQELLHEARSEPQPAEKSGPPK